MPGHLVRKGLDPCIISRLWFFCLHISATMLTWSTCPSFGPSLPLLPNDSHRNPPISGIWVASKDIFQMMNLLVLFSWELHHVEYWCWNWSSQSFLVFFLTVHANPFIAFYLADFINLGMEITQSWPSANMLLFIVHDHLKSTVLPCYW